MGQRMDLDRIYEKARKAVMAGFYDDRGPGGAPDTCPVTLDDLLDENASAGMLGKTFSRAI